MFSWLWLCISFGDRDRSCYIKHVHVSGVGEVVFLQYKSLQPCKEPYVNKDTIYNLSLL